MHPDKDSMIEQAYELYSQSNSAYRQYLATVASAKGDECLDLIIKEEMKDTFDQSHPGHISGLYLAAVTNNRFIWTDKGLNWVKEKIIELTDKNEYLANRMVGCFRFVSKMQPNLKSKVAKVLEDMLEKLDSKSYVAKSIMSFLAS
jgi:hypothetical protein